MLCYLISTAIATDLKQTNFIKKRDLFTSGFWSGASIGSAFGEGPKVHGTTTQEQVHKEKATSPNRKLEIHPMVRLTLLRTHS